jgi:hypothetical protein
MRQAWRGLAGLLAIGALATGSSVALADGGGGHGGHGGGNKGNAIAPATIFTMPATPGGNPEGIAFDKSSGRFFVSRTGNGDIFSGTPDQTTPLTQFIAGTATGTPPLATGMKVRKGKLYVAGATTGEIRVYDLANPTAAPVVFQTGGGFINDLDLNGHGDVFATDSTKSTIYKVTAEQVAAGTGTPQAIDVSSGITSTPNEFNLNGIVAKGHALIVVNSFSGELFRITFDDDAPVIEKIDLGAADVKNGDGLLIDRGRLLVVRGSNGTTAPAQGSNGLIDVVKLSHHQTRGRVESTIFDASFSGPSTIARAGKQLLVVNASFTAGPNADGNFTVTGLARNAVRHGGHGGHGGH